MLTKTYPFTETEGVAIAARVKAASDNQIVIDPTQPNGEAETHGVKIAWEIASEIVTVTVKTKPFWISWDAIGDELDKLFAGVQG